MKKGWIATAFFILLLFAAVGCSRLTMDNYNKIKGGMAYDEVVNIRARRLNATML